MWGVYQEGMIKWDTFGRDVPAELSTHIFCILNDYEAQHLPKGSWVQIHGIIPFCQR